MMRIAYDYRLFFAIRLPPSRIRLPGLSSNNVWLADSRLTLNLKAKKGQEIAKKLVEEADVLVEN
jgi:hypothetical protein